MQRWNFKEMLEGARKLFDKIYRRKRFAHFNHEIHFLAREKEDWLQEGIHAMIEGSYSPRHLRRRYFEDEIIDQLHLSDRIFQHLLLKQLKPTFQYVMNKNCLHLAGPSAGVKQANQRILQALGELKYPYVIRADIKSYYRSILHYKLIQDLKQAYDDPALLNMLENIIKNPVETARGYKNDHSGIALRGPLSQFFSAIYLKPLDDAFDPMDVVYLRYQDDILILCKTKRQLNRCQRRLHEVLHERGLTLSRKKSRIGSIETFHFLGIHYSGTQSQGTINEVTTHSETMNVASVVETEVAEIGGGGTT